MAAGRPSKYKKEYCKQVVDFMGKGNSGVQFAAKIGVSKDTILEWCKEHPEFSVAYKEAMTLCEAHWEKVMQIKALKKTGGSDSMLKFWMMNRFRWSDKTDSNIKSEETITFTTQIGKDGEVNREQS